MLDIGYTLHNSPAAVARIERDLGVVIDEVRRADPGLRSLILTGGFARGEGGVLDDVPQNDYDLVAVRGLRRPRVPYGQVREHLEARLGLHVDLSTIAAWRLPWVGRSIFWYETALAGRVLWGENLLDRIPVRSPHAINPTEGLRLLTNRAAGLLLVTEKPGPAAQNLQASKALLAVLDVHLLSLGRFPPSQRERWADLQRLLGDGLAPPDLGPLLPWLEWAYQFKLEPGHAPERDHEQAWRVAANAILDAIPVALRHARLGSLEAYADSDGIADRWYHWRRTGQLVRNPSGRVRLATLRLLEASQDGRIRPESADELLAPMVGRVERPVAALESLRAATLQ